MTVDWKFKIGDLIERADGKHKGRIIACVMEENGEGVFRSYRIFWLGQDALSEQTQFQFFAQELIEEFYVKSV